MSTPVITFFNNKGGVGKTSLVYHLSWMLSENGYRIVALDLDPQANLTAAFASEKELEVLWNQTGKTPGTIYQSVKPLAGIADLIPVQPRKIHSDLYLIPGDLGLSNFEETLSGQWSDALGEANLERPFRILTAFWQVAQKAAEELNADFILADVGPSLGAINRSALIATDYVVIPLGADLYSLQGLQNLGPALRNWRTSWKNGGTTGRRPVFPCLKGAWSRWVILSSNPSCV